MKRAVITGATGAVGTALVKNLISNGIEVLVITRKDSTRNGVIPKSGLVTLKYCSLEELEDIRNDTGKEWDVFYHFAWAGTFGNSRNDMYAQNQNVKYSLDAVNAAKKFGCHTFIGAGSQAEYGRFEGKLTPETAAFPENGYGIAKLCAGQMTREYSRQLGINHIWVRILSVYGENDGANTMVSSTVNKLKAGKTAEFTKGEQLWDYLYSGDAAEAFRLLGDKGRDGKIYVLGSGKAMPLKDYISIIGKCLNAEHLLKIGALPYADRQVMYLCADVSKLFEDTGWRAETAFEQGIRNLIED